MPPAMKGKTTSISAGKPATETLHGRDFTTGMSYPLGATVAAAGANFSLFSRSATGVELLLFDRADEFSPRRIIELDPRTQRTYHYWHVFVPGVNAGQLYGYRVYGPSDPARGMRFDSAKVLLDPYGRGVVVPPNYRRQAAAQLGENTAIAMKSVVADPSAYDWEGDEPLHRPLQQVLDDGDGSGRCYFMPSAGYYLIRDQQTVLSSGPLAGLAGLLFDRTFGLVSHAAIYLLAFVGIVPLWRRARRGHGAEVAVLVLSGVLLIGYISDIAYWWADGMPSSRYLVAPLPLLAVLLALGIEALVLAWRRVGWVIVALLAIPSALVTGLYTVQPELGYDLAVDVQRSGYPGRLWQYLYDHWGVDPGLLFPSLVRPDGTVTLVVWCAIALGLVVVGAALRPALRPAAVPGSPASSETG